MCNLNYILWLCNAGLSRNLTFPNGSLKLGGSCIGWGFSMATAVVRNLSFATSGFLMALPESALSMVSFTLTFSLRVTCTLINIVRGM